MTPLAMPCPPTPVSRSRLLSSTLLAALCGTLIAFAPIAIADTLVDVSKMLRQGQHTQALEEIDKYLSGKPRDAQGRFLKGIILTEMNRSNEAIAVFTKLAEDYPELPEPYNNLAVIYAQQKNYEKARQSLEMAIRTHPSYATAHENLGDIYARLASQAYDKALQLDSSNASAQGKLALIRELMSTSSRPAKAGKPAPAAEPAKPVETAKAPAAATPATTVATAPATAAVSPVPAKAAEPAKPSQAATSNGEVIKAVDRWMAAWSRKDVKAYLAMYARDFKTPGGGPRAAWEADRKSKISRPGAISIIHDGLTVTFEDDTAIVKFRQHYKSNALKTSSNKVLVMVKRDGNWLIQQERVGN